MAEIKAKMPNQRLEKLFYYCSRGSGALSSLRQSKIGVAVSVVTAVVISFAVYLQWQDLQTNEHLAGELTKVNVNVEQDTVFKTNNSSLDTPISPAKSLVKQVAVQQHHGDSNHSSETSHTKDNKTTLKEIKHHNHHLDEKKKREAEKRSKCAEFKGVLPIRLSISKRGELFSAGSLITEDYLVTHLNQQPYGCNKARLFLSLEYGTSERYVDSLVDLIEGSDMSLISTPVIIKERSFGKN